MNPFSLLYFGKLPQQAEFIRKNADGPEIIKIDHWFEEALLSARSQAMVSWETLYANAPSLHFLISPLPARPLVGIWRPSRDQIGRSFPFIVAARFGQNNGMDVNAILKDERVKILLASMEHASRGIVEKADWGEWVRLSQEASAVVDLSCPQVSYDEYLHKTLLLDVLQETFGEAAVIHAYRLFYNMDQSLSALRGKDFEHVELGLQFPLCGELEYLLYQVHFWHDLTITLLGRGVDAPALFWTCHSVGSNGDLFWYFRLPGPKNLYNWLTPQIDNDHICNPCVEGSGDLDALRSSMAAKIVAILQRKDLSLHDLLSNLK